MTSSSRLTTTLPLAAVLQVGVVGQVVAAVVLDGADALDFRLDAAHDAHFINVPDDGGHPVN